jgi:transcription elongation factor Elf1
MSTLVKIKNKIKETFRCKVCTKANMNIPFFWSTTRGELKVCRKCGYRERFGTKGMIEHSKLNTIEGEYEQSKA